jgi:hypothetical protein
MGHCETAAVEDEFMIACARIELDRARRRRPIQATGLKLCRS